MLRDFQGLIDGGGKAKVIGRRLKAYAHRLFHHWHRYRDGSITRQTMRRNLRKLWWPVYEALEEGAIGLRGKQARMCRHILDRVDHLWTFLTHEEVEPTNNASERALRHAVIWRKLSFGTQSARRQNRDVFTYITEAVQAHFNGDATTNLSFGVSTVACEEQAEEHEDGSEGYKPRRGDSFRDCSLLRMRHMAIYITAHRPGTP